MVLAALLVSPTHGLAFTARPVLTVTQHHRTACTSGCILHSLAASRSRGVHMMPAPDAEGKVTEERKEALLGLGIMSGLFAGTFGFYYVLTSLGGVDEVLAGQLVLLALVAFGAFLVFADGGATQAALESSAVQQMAAEEGGLMRQAPREALPTRTAAAATAEPAAAAATLRTEGLLRVDGLVPPEATAALVEYVEKRLQAGRVAVKEDVMREYQYFGAVLCRNNRFALGLGLGLELGLAFGLGFGLGLALASPNPNPNPNANPSPNPNQVRPQAGARARGRGGAPARGVNPNPRW